MSRRYLLDTNTVGHLIYQRFGVPERANAVKAQGAVIGTALPVVGELFYGVEKSSSRDFSLKAIERGISNLKLWSFDLAAAKEYGRIAALLRRIGRPMQVVDIQIAAVVLTLGCTVVTTDSDLLAVPDLPVENWTAPPSPPVATTL